MNVPSWSSVVLISAVIAVVSSLTTHWAGETGRLAVLFGEPASAAPRPGPAVVVVPKLVGLPSDVAAELMTARGLRYVVREMRESKEFPEGTVALQEPLPGSSLSRNGTVSVSVSTGRGNTKPLQDLAGMTLPEAVEALKQAGFVAEPIKGAAVGAIVTETVPPAGTELAPAAKVTLKWDSTMVEVPKVVGLPVRKARKKLEAAGLKLGKIRSRFVEERPAWAVLKQSPDAGEVAELGTAVNLVRNED